MKLLSDHVHLIVEADNNQALSTGMNGCNSRIAITLNKLWCRGGKVFRERFHDRVLKTLREVRNALKYVLTGHLEHDAPFRPIAIDAVPGAS